MQMIEAPGWCFTKDQWEPEMWAKVFRKIAAEDFVYCTHTIPREDYCMIPGQCGLDYLADPEGRPSARRCGRWGERPSPGRGPAPRQGRRARVAFIREGPYAIPPNSRRGKGPFVTGSSRWTVSARPSVHRRRGRALLLGPAGCASGSSAPTAQERHPRSDGLRLFAPYGRGPSKSRPGRHGASPSIKSRIGVCQQENNVDPDLTVLQNLLAFAGYFDIPAARAQERALELLRFMALENRADARISELSGGMVRRLVMARALLNRPELLILDEPTTGLDPQSRHQVWEKLEALRLEGLTILLTTHYMEEASRLCERLLILDGGRLLVEGKPAELVRRHVGSHVIEVSRPAASLPDFLGARGIPYERIGQRLLVALEEGSDLYREIDGRFCEGSCTLRMATLEDVFLRLTGRELRE